jgi:lysophospholipase L1-like esterase
MITFASNSMKQAANRLVRPSPYLVAAAMLFAAAAFAADDPANPALPSLFVAGDSTAADGTPDAIGRGKHLPRFFDLTEINVVNEARGGRSSRTFVAEGLWDRLLNSVKKNDCVLIQFGQNDGAEMNGERIARGSLPGLGEESQEIDNQATKLHETVHTFGWYMRKMIHETQDKGAMPILCSLTVRNICTLIPRNTWEGGKIARPSGTHADWAREVAKAENVPLLDLYQRIAERYDPMGEEAVTALFADKRVHTSKAGAELNASIVVAALRAPANDPAARFLRQEPAPLR